MTKYLWTRWRQTAIERVEVESESLKSVWVKLTTMGGQSYTRRALKFTNDQIYFDTFEEAKNHLLAYLKDRCEQYQQIWLKEKIKLSAARDLREEDVEGARP